MGHCGTQIRIMQDAIGKRMGEMEAGSSGSLLEMQIFSCIFLVMNNGCIFRPSEESHNVSSL